MLFEEENDLTIEAMNSPMPGDRFTEMFSFYVYVLKRDGDMITFMECNAPCELPKDGKVKRLPLDSFKKRYAYGTIPGYSIRLCDRGNNVEGWDTLGIIEYQPETTSEKAAIIKEAVTQESTLIKLLLALGQRLHDTQPGTPEHEAARASWRNMRQEWGV